MSEKTVLAPVLPDLAILKFKTGFKPILYRFGTSPNIKPKNVTIKNLLKTDFKLLLHQFLRVATFWATHGKRLAMFVSTFLAAMFTNYPEIIHAGATRAEGEKYETLSIHDGN